MAGAAGYVPYVFKLTSNGDGSFTIGAKTGGSVYKVTDTADEPGDDPTQLGDIADDHFQVTSDSGYIGTAAYVGAVAGQKGFVSRTVETTGGSETTKGYYLNAYDQYDPGTVFTPSAEPHALACYVTGTRILTTRGEIAIEDLRIGDEVVTAAGVAHKIRWIGHRAYARRFANANPALLPVCFKAGSLAENVPARDLEVSPRHAMFLDGVLIPAEHLVNGVSILRAEYVDDLTYWHVELDNHDVLLAEGAPSESFVDDDSRGLFHNVGEFRALYPDAAPAEARYCAPRVEDGYVLEAVRRRLDAHAIAAGRRAA